MLLLKILLIVVGLLFLVFGYLIFFKGKYGLINGFEDDYKAGRKTKSYAKKVGSIELTLGALSLLAGLGLMLFV